MHVGANIAYEEGENKEENQTAYNDKVVHADVTINEYTKPGAGNIDEGTLEELQVLVATAKTAAKTSEDNAKLFEQNASVSEVNAANSASSAEEAKTSAEQSATA